MKKIKKLNKIQGYKVDCKRHQSMNSCRGVIFSKRLIKYSEEKLLQEFKDQHVTGVKRIKKKVNDELLPTPLLILTFDLLRLPPTISAAWMRIHIRPYIPSPRRCFHCQKIGHLTTSCRNKAKGEPEICVNCGMPRHGECEKASCCANCGENHPSSSRNCTHYVREKEILTLKITERISFREAKNKVNQKYGPLKRSFADATKSSVKPKVKDSQSSHDMPEPRTIEVEVEVHTNKRTLSNTFIELPGKIQRSGAVPKMLAKKSVDPSISDGSLHHPPSLTEGAQTTSSPSTGGSSIDLPQNIEESLEDSSTRTGEIASPFLVTLDNRTARTGEITSPTPVAPEKSAVLDDPGGVLSPKPQRVFTPRTQATHAVDVAPRGEKSRVGGGNSTSIHKKQPHTSTPYKKETAGSGNFLKRESNKNK